MATVTGDYVRNFAAAADQSPLVDANLAAVFGVARINGGTLNCATDAVLLKLVGKTYGAVRKVRYEYWSGVSYDWTGCAMVDDTTGELNYRSAIFYLAGNTPKLTVSQDADFPTSPDEWLIGRYPDIVGLAQGDVFELEHDTTYTPHRWTVRRNGAVMQTNDGADYVANSVLGAALVPAWFVNSGDVANGRIRSIGVVGVIESDTTAPSITAGPTAANLATTGFDVLSTWNEACTVSLLVTAPGAAQPADATFDASTETAIATAGVQVSNHHNG